MHGLESKLHLDQDDARATGAGATDRAARPADTATRVGSATRTVRPAAMNAMPRGMVALGFLGALSATALAQAPSEVCPAYTRSIKISFTTLDPEPSYNNSLNVTSICDFLRVRGHVFAGRHEKTLGLTSYQLGFAMSGKTYAVPSRGGYCVYLSEVIAEYGYRNHDVFVASEFAPGSCEYNAILDHENQHVAINRTAVKGAGPQLRQELERQLEALKPKFTRDPQLGTDRALSEVYVVMNKVIDAAGAAQASRNAAIDTQYNYGAIGDLCKNWEQGNRWPRSKAP